MIVEVCYALSDGATRIDVTLADGATAQEAIDRSGIVTALSLDAATLTIAIFGRRATGATPLAHGDRVELLRPLVVDPMEARRRRVAKKRGN